MAPEGVTFCGCRVILGPDEQNRIEYCDMHAAARVMLQALLKVSKFSTWDFVEDAIAKARGVYKNG